MMEMETKSFMATLRQLRLRWKMAVALAVAYSVAHFAYSAVWFASRSLGGDFISAFPGPLAWRLAQHWGLFRPWLTNVYFDFPIWNYGPVLHFVTLPLILAPTQAQAMQIVLWVDYALVSATFFLWIKLLFPEKGHVLARLGLACFWLNYFPLLEAVTGREIELFELFLISLGLWLLRRNKQVAAGLAIGFAAMTKFLPLLFIPYLRIRGYRKAFWTALLTVLFLTILGQRTLGFANSWTFILISQQQNNLYFPAAYANQAILNIFYKMFTVFDMNQPHPTTLYPTILRFVGRVVNWLILAAYSWLIIRRRKDDQLLEVEWALLAIVMVLVAPHANTYYLVFALPAFSVAFAYWVKHPDCVGRLLKVALAAGAVCTGFLVPMKVLEAVFQLPGVVVARILQLYSLPAFGVIFVALVLVEWHRIIRTGQAPAMMPAHSAQS